jgi:putative transposase
VAAELVGVKPEIVFAPGKERKRVRARSLLCYWAVRELGISMTNLTKVLNMSLSAVGAAVERGEKLVVANDYQLTEILNM